MNIHTYQPLQGTGQVLPLAVAQDQHFWQHIQCQWIVRFMSTCGFKAFNGKEKVLSQRQTTLSVLAYSLPKSRLFCS